MAKTSKLSQKVQEGGARELETGDTEKRFNEKLERSQSKSRRLPQRNRNSNERALV
jgi:hypothetical protein